MRRHVGLAAVLACMCASVCAALPTVHAPSDDEPSYLAYHNFSMIEAATTDLLTRYPHYIRLKSEFRSQKGQLQYVLQVSDFSIREHRKTAVLLSYGEHARELFPVESGLHFLRNLTAGMQQPDDSDAHRFSKMVLTKFNVLMILMANPDGRLIVERTRNFCWRGTSTGVDLNRNTDWEFGGPGSSDNPKDEEYRGPFSFSEPENRVYPALTDQYKVEAFLSFHTGVCHIFVPYADSKSKRIDRKPPELRAMTRIAMRMAKAADPRLQCRAGRSKDIDDYPADGTIPDYMTGIRNVPISLTVELYGTSDEKAKCFAVFNPNSDQLSAAIDSVFPMYAAFFNSMLRDNDDDENPLLEILTPSFSVPLIVIVCLSAVIVVLSSTRLRTVLRIVSPWRW